METILVVIDIFKQQTSGEVKLNIQHLNRLVKTVTFGLDHNSFCFKIVVETFSAWDPA